MAVYTVFAPRTADGAIDPMAPVFVKEGWSWPAFFFAEIWMIISRMWLVLVLYVAAVIAIAALGRIIGDNLAGMVIFVGHLLFALEGNELKRWTLSRRGFHMIALVEGRNEEEAEIRFFARSEGMAAADATAQEPPTTRPSMPTAPSPSDEIVGLFPAPAEGPRS